MNRSVLLALFAITVAGCSQPEHQSSPIPEIPDRALLAKEGIGRLFFQATDTGTIYVYDPATLQIVHVQPIQQNERFVLDPAHDVATVEGKTVLVKQLNAKHIYRLYFLPGGATTAPTTLP